MISCFSVFLWSIDIYFPPIVIRSSFVNLAPPLDQVDQGPWCQTRLRRSLEILTFGQKRFSRNNVRRQLRQIFNRTTSRTLSRCNVFDNFFFSYVKTFSIFRPFSWCNISAQILNITFLQPFLLSIYSKHFPDAISANQTDVNSSSFSFQ